MSHMAVRLLIVLKIENSTIPWNSNHRESICFIHQITQFKIFSFL